ncbi:MAG TPA: histidine--tRNA ligase [Syntrophobacteraceae bacterium]|nr:histidine--tRNA ligase [Syntrophobacteraceae bacterium]
MQSIQAVRGMNDILPDAVGWWRRVENAAREVLESFGYREVRTPLAEKLELFARSIGESTDIVEKEMYAFQDRNGEWIALRPEATASIVRSYIQHGLHSDSALRKLYEIGPMFRHERPQKGRYRQFHQIDAEAFGTDSPMIDAEMMHMLSLLVERIGISGVILHVNTLGCPECRQTYKEILKGFLKEKADLFCPDCVRRRETNPLRVFDCKVEKCQALLDRAPMLIDYVCRDCRAHFDAVKDYLDKLATRYEVNPRIVRGLDYYMRTTFEVISDRLGAQNAIGGGGRYNGLVRDLGGPDVAAIGFAIGVERLIMLLQQEREQILRAPRFFLVGLGEKPLEKAFLLLQQLRGRGLEAEMDYGGRSLKSQMRRADKSGARYVLILGENELVQRQIQVRDMLAGTQELLPLDAIVEGVEGLRD